MLATFRMLGGLVCVWQLCLNGLSQVDAVPLMRASGPSEPYTAARVGEGTLMRSNRHDSAVVQHDGNVVALSLSEPRTVLRSDGDESTNASRIDRRSLLTKRASAGCRFHKRGVAGRIFATALTTPCNTETLTSARAINGCSSPDKISCGAIEVICSERWNRKGSTCTKLMTKLMCVEDIESSENDHSKRSFCLKKRTLQNGAAPLWWTRAQGNADQALWPQFGATSTRCTSAGLHVVADREECQAEAVAAGHNFYQFEVTRLKCATASTCGSPLATPNNVWKIFKATQASLLQTELHDRQSRGHDLQADKLLQQRLDEGLKDKPCG